MRKIIAIGESVLDTIFKDDQPVRSFMGGRIANTAAILGTMHLPVAMVSECCADSVGDIIINYLTRHNVNVTSIDRYTEGSTSLSAIFNEGGKDKLVNYGVYPKNRFDVVWPRIDEDDILLFMPAILENLEVSDLVIAHERDLRDVFPNETPQQAFTNHVEFYCDNYLHINPDLTVTRFNKGGRAVPHPAIGVPNQHMLGWQAGFTAGVIYGLLKNEVTHANVHQLPRPAWADIVTSAQAIAAACANPDNCIDETLAARYATDLNA